MLRPFEAFAAWIKNLTKGKRKRSCKREKEGRGGGKERKGKEAGREGVELNGPEAHATVWLS